MSENVKTGSIFGLHGILGALIAVVLLLTIEVSLITTGLFIQQDNATNYYDVDKAKLQIIDVGSADNSDAK